MRLTSYPTTVRQLIVTGLGCDQPTVLITNDHELPTKALIEHYARRMTIEQRLAEIIQAVHADALSSAVNVDLDISSASWPKPCLPHCAPDYPVTSPSPRRLQRRFLPGKIITKVDTITVRLDRRAYAPLLRQADLPNDTTVPWWNNRTLRYEFA